MGGFLGSLTGSNGRKAAKKAAAVQAQQFQQIMGMYKPIADAGTAQIASLTSDATAQGFGSNIGDILGGGALDELIRERQDAATGYMAARGLRRSGAAAQQAADIPAELAMQIEGELNRRRQALYAGGAAGVNGMAGGAEGVGAAKASGYYGAAQAGAQGAQNILGIGKALMGLF
jgi:hypothetical protein